MGKKMKLVQLSVVCPILLYAIVFGLAVQVAANQQPVAVAKSDNQAIYIGEEAWFSGNDSYDPDGSIASFFWDFQDGTTSGESNTSHIYSVPGNYTVVLTVTDDLGGTDSDSVNVTVLEGSSSTTTVWIESLFTDKGEYKVTETINATVAIARDYGNGPPVWEGILIFEVFNDTMVIVHYDERQVFLADFTASGNSLFDFNVTEAGEYLVRASLYDESDVFIEKKEINITVTSQLQNQLPVVVLYVDRQTVNIGEPVWFYAHLSHDPDGFITLYHWDLGDGSFKSGINTSHVYNSPGNYSVTLTVTDNGNAASVDIISVEVVALGGGPADVKRPSPEGYKLWGMFSAAIAGAGILLILTLIFGTDNGRYRFYSFLLPLYTKLKKEEILDDFTRGKIYGYILANPGDSYNSIKKALKLSDGSFYHHIHILEKEGIIKSARDGTYRRFYPSGMRIPSNKGSLKSSQLLIIQKIQEHPGISQKDIAALLGVSSPTINYHIKELIKLGIIRAERAGMRLRYFVADMEMIPKGTLESEQKKEFIDYG
jgi:predicted transcriptional regulator/chitodextrinase